MTGFLVFYIPGAAVYAAIAVGIYAGTGKGDAAHRAAARALILIPVWPAVSVAFLGRWVVRIWRDAWKHI